MSKVQMLRSLVNQRLTAAAEEIPEPSHIKEEQEELCTNQEGEQLQGLEEADVKFSFTPVKMGP
ncbi:uncharacterized protein PEZ65_009515 [Lycodopsis pacificus]